VFGVLADVHGFGWAWLFVAALSGVAAIMMAAAAATVGSGVEQLHQ